MESNKILYYFYRLVDPIDGLTKYIGRTVDLKNRFRNHIYESKKNNRNLKERWIVSLIKKNLEPIMKLIYSTYCTIEEAIEFEKLYINLYSKYYKLKNSADNYLGLVLTGTEVYQYNLQGYLIKRYFNSHQAWLETGIKDCNILRCCKNENKYGCKSAGGFFWSFTKYNKYPHKYEKKYMIKPVIQYDLNNIKLNEFISAREAFKFTGIHFGLISKACKQDTKTAGGFIWKFKDLTKVVELNDNTNFGQEIACAGGLCNLEI